MQAMSRHYPAMMVDPRPQVSLERIASMLDEVLADIREMREQIFALETENDMLKDAIEELDT